MYAPFARRSGVSAKVSESVARPTLRTASGLKATFADGNGTSPTLTATDFGRDFTPESVPPTQGMSVLESTSYQARGSLMESVHAPKRSLTPIVCETSVSGAVTTASEIAHIPSGCGGAKAKAKVGVAGDFVQA